MVSPTRSTLLNSILGHSPRDLLKIEPSGQRRFKRLYQDGISAGLPLQSANSDEEMLHALFTYVVDHNMGCFVHDFVTEVCLDYSMTSSTEEAVLSDGACMIRWASGLIPYRPPAAAAGSPPLQNFASLARLTSTLPVLDTLARAAGPIEEAPPHLQELLQHNLLQLQYLQVQGPTSLLPGFEPDKIQLSSRRYSSIAAWRTLITKRRDTCLQQRPPTPPFLDSLLAAVRDAGVSVAYPLDSPHGAMGKLFLAGQATPQAFRAKLALLTYYTLDAGFISDTRLLRSALSLSLEEAAQWEAYFLLDMGSLLQDASWGRTAKECCTAAKNLLSGLRWEKAVDQRIVDRLVGLEMPQVALSMLQAQGTQVSPVPQDTDPLGGTRSLIAALVACGIPSQALAELRKEVERAGENSKMEIRKQLVACLADNMRLRGGMNPLLSLPFEFQEEKALMQWLEQQVEGAGLEEEWKALYYLQRARLPEALLANALAQGNPDSAGTALPADLRKVQEMMAEALPTLPDPQKALWWVPRYAVGPQHHWTSGTQATPRHRRPCHYWRASPNGHPGRRATRPSLPRLPQGTQYPCLASLDTTLPLLKPWGPFLVAPLWRPTVPRSPWVWTPRSLRAPLRAAVDRSEAARRHAFVWVHGRVPPRRPERPSLDRPAQHVRARLPLTETSAVRMIRWPAPGEDPEDGTSAVRFGRPNGPASSRISLSPLTNAVSLGFTLHSKSCFIRWCHDRL
eukprot:jgi/Botrbrau1/9955/Bobra.0012s0050.1